MQAEEFIGLDIGSAHVGVARGNSVARLAEPMPTIKAADTLAKLEEWVKATRAAGVVVGLPRNLRGEDTEQTRAVRQWVSQAKLQINLPFYWQDEALTSTPTSAQHHTHDDHSQAAVIILNDFLNTPADDRMIA